MTDDRVVGSVTGPGGDANEFYFVAPTVDEVKTGEFLTYTVDADGDSRRLVARVTNREQERGLPASFMANPTVSPQSVASALGVPATDTDLYRFTATVVGYYDDVMAAFVNPRVLPRPGTQLRLAPAELLEAVLPNGDPDGDAAMAEIGWLLNRPPGETTLRVPIDEFTATHLAILASTGSGKSYAAGVLIEELMRPSSRAALLVVDPHGEYGTLIAMMEEEHSGVFRDETDGYRPEVNIVTADDVTIRISDLTFHDLLSLLDVSSRMESVLRRAWERVQGGPSVQITVEDIINACHAVDDGPSADALEWRLEDALDRDLFHEAQRVALDDLVQPGRATILQLSGMSRKNQQMLAGVLLRRLYHARAAARETAAEADRTREIIEYPIFTLLEEGHRFAPDGRAQSLDIIRTITSEGRKFGFGLGIISQRPGKIDADVLSQCGTQLIMQIQNPTDQEAIRRSIESAGEDVLRELPGLTPGQAVIAGDAMNTPVLIQVRQRHTPHGAASPATTRNWRDAWGERDSEPRGVRNADDDEELEDYGSL